MTQRVAGADESNAQRVGQLERSDSELRAGDPKLRGRTARRTVAKTAPCGTCRFGKRGSLIFQNGSQNQTSRERPRDKSSCGPLAGFGDASAGTKTSGLVRARNVSRSSGGKTNCVDGTVTGARSTHRKNTGWWKVAQNPQFWRSAEQFL